MSFGPPLPVSLCCKSERQKDEIREERWIETEGFTNNDDDDDDDDPQSFQLFADPDPYDSFSFTFHVQQHSTTTKAKDIINEATVVDIDIRLKGVKTENGQTISSTGRTLWRASSLLCDYICCHHHRLIRDKTVMELGAGLGLCSILAHKLGASRVVATDGDTDTLMGLRENVNANIPTTTTVHPHGEKKSEASSVNELPCRQLRWGHDVETFKNQWINLFFADTTATNTSSSVPCDNMDDDNGNDHDRSSNRVGGGFDIVMGSDIIYVEVILEPLFDTVDSLLSNDGYFLLSYARRNVPMDLVLDYAKRHRFILLEAPSDIESEGVFVFTRSQ